MQEIYRNQEYELSVKAPIANAVYSGTVTSEGWPTPTQFQNLVPAGGHINIPLDFGHSMIDGPINIDITIARSDGAVYNIKDRAQVVTPLFDFSDLPTDQGYKEEDWRELERLVRHVVEAYTGQSFGKYRDTRVVSENSNIVSLDVPMIEFIGVGDRYITHSTTLTPPKLPHEIFNDGYDLKIDWSNYHVKTDSMWILSKRPNGCRLITGYFGYEYVPADVKEAALLIAGMWGCNQAVWRDRYIQTMRSSDWSVTYNDRGFEFTTGSVTADLLLSKYSRKYVPEVI